MTEAANLTREFVRYRQLERRLWLVRWRNAGEESAEEDAALDEMDAAWMQLSEREQAILRAEGPRGWPMDSSALPPQFADARWIAEPEPWAYEGFDTAAQTDPLRGSALNMESQFGNFAAELTGWFDNVFDSTQNCLFGIAPEGPHRDAVVVDSMIRNARIIYRAELDKEGKLYSPLCFFQVAACRHLGARLGAGHWRAALENLCQTQELPGLEAFGLPWGTPAYRFKSELDAAIEQAGFIDRASLLNKEDRKVAIGLGVNWAIRLLLAQAGDYPNPVESPGHRDFTWLATRVQAALAACKQ